MFIRRENFKQYITLYPVVSSIIALNLVIYLLTLIPGFGEDLIYAGMSVNILIADGEWWRIITSMFIHAGFTHVLFNMAAKVSRFINICKIYSKIIIHWKQ